MSGDIDKALAKLSEAGEKATTGVALDSLLFFAFARNSWPELMAVVRAADDVSEQDGYHGLRELRAALAALAAKVATPADACETRGE